MGDAIDLTGDGGVMKRIVRRAKADAVGPTENVPLVDELQQMSEKETSNKPPLWKYVTVKEIIGKGGGNVKFVCSYCGKCVTGSYSRVKGHLLKVSGHGVAKCLKVTSTDLTNMKRESDEYDAMVRNSRAPQVSLPPSNRIMSCSSTASTPSTMRQSTFEPILSKRKKFIGDCPPEKAFNLEARQELDSEIARMFYSSGAAFTLAKNPYYVSSFTKAANCRNLSGYVPPDYNSLRNSLLVKERAHIESYLNPLKTSWKEKGVSIVSDGWTDSQRRPIINFMAVCESGPMFLKAINYEGEYKDKFFIAKLLKECIDSVGPQNVVQVITDNVPVCKGAGLLIESQFPHIFWTPCVVHTLNLVLQNICATKNSEANAETFQECSWITDIIRDVMAIMIFIMNHNMRLAMFNAHSDLKMLSMADTRFASSIIMLKRFKQIKQSLLSMVISPDWANYRKDDILKAAQIKEKVLDDLWWDKVDYILSFTEPMYDMLRKTDTDKPCLHLIYDMWDTMIEKVKVAIYRHEGKVDHELSDFYSVVHQILVDGWTKSNTPLHCLAHSLNPRYYSVQWLDESPLRLPPHKDDEISAMRLKCFGRYFTNEIERRQVNTEFAKFSAAFREFANSDSINDRGLMDPDLWWVIHGSSTPLLQNLALKLLGQPSSSSCCERNWSTYSFINSLIRNKTTPQRGEDLVFVHSNLRLLSRQSPLYTKGESSMWDVGGDAFDTMDGVGILEVANLSLDEPELEAMLFTSDGVGNVDEIL